jgi:hypothetical protein
VEGSDVLERDEDVAVQLDVGHVLDRAVGGERALLVLPAEEGDLDLLALVLVRVVLDGRKLAKTSAVTAGSNAEPDRVETSSRRDARLRVSPATSRRESAVPRTRRTRRAARIRQ